ncbi:ArsR/SmtB family transcription factor [Actinomadura algeriensis]|uniref:DNA-binding transcriptional ArsR family regulator n=1 Tax=Actinomadura algeriensis TaxID=1679523 RepID=A0ABR9K1Z6_9ACTN|nr:metalloregulator ArsR/SmtB family transcription factor [Actinomadura algeriensis]MBE1536875.1 DNA-binding transcriptional ArsR family regulator [Actinomadura algeriensis]
MSREPVAATEVFKALGDPIRWSIVQQIAREDEFACSLLEDMLPVSKPTISYHTKILSQAGLIEVHKRGRNYFYSLRRDVVREVMGELSELAPGAGPIADERNGAGRDGSAARAKETRAASAAGEGDAAILTW